ncbi:uncharacterized protein LOC111369057 [Olea europaea var. sylvestris]|uniref:uncharacterized protein LOC111369057 n=1 Tax=Olea europaea var. sylvestris TaxID=158386 RepID=UPI000C1D33DB|nr:uncharacterized protein LOC111369057 [Olea europaea var. sylvestris]
MHGTYRGFFKSFRGIRQGDPLSPYLFIIVEETLTRVLRKASSIKAVVEILGIYENMSGQKVNHRKSAIFFLKYMSLQRKNESLCLSNFTQGSFPITYLGAPIALGHLCIRHFEPLIMKVRKKISGWKSLLLSIGERLTLVKHVLLSMHIHILSVICIPQGVIHQIHSLISNFIWREADGKAK